MRRVIIMDKKIKKENTLPGTVLTEEQLYQMKQRVTNWHEFFHKKVFLPLTRNI
jgi:hypothetical protein